MMYIHRMIRTQLYLGTDIHARLRRLAKQQGRTVSDLVREALERAYGRAGVDERLATMEAIGGLWRGREDLEDTPAFVRRLRRSTHRKVPRS
jgi:predicted DNA-binding protein